MKRYTHDLETDLNDVDKTPSLIHKTLLTASTIYDLKYLAQVLNDENGSNCPVHPLNVRLHAYLSIVS